MTDETIFATALDKANLAEQAAFLIEACGDDMERRKRLDELLVAHAGAAHFLERPAVAVPDPDAVATCTVGHEGKAPAGGDEIPLGFLEPALRPGSLGRIGHYEVLQVLGQGGFGIVFRAFDDVLQRVVAIKIMAPQIATLSPARKRFLREARSSAAVRHENVVHVYEVGEQPLPHLVMEFIPGQTLQQKLDGSGPLEVGEVLRIGRQVAEGLAAAHASDLIHRDIKPSNILLEGGSQKVKITDFGLARAADDASISQSGVIAGTPMFMAPEQARGHTIDRRADLFSLGSVLYQMVSGRPPFRAPSMLAVLKRVTEEAPRPIREIIPETPAWLCGIIAKLHAKNPDDRFQSARELADVLADCEAQLKAHAKIKDFSRIPRGKPRRSGRWKWAAAAAVLLLPVIALAVMEFAEVTHLLRGQLATTDPIKPADEPGLNRAVKPGLLVPTGWVNLFNGTDLTGWKPHPLATGEEDWRVEEGAITGRCRGSTAFLFSAAEYANFHLRVEAKINGTGDSGIFFRAPFEVRTHKGQSKFFVPGGYEAQICVRPDWRNHTGSILDSGKDVLWLAPWMNHRPDEWFVLEIIADGNRLRTRVNGQTTADFLDEKRRYFRGHLALQAWGWNVTFAQFRKMEIKELPASASALPPTIKNRIGMEFVIVPKGKAWLGGDKDKLGDQEVEIPADFYLGKYEVTQEEWEKVMGENPSHFSGTGEGKDAVKGIPDADLKRFPVENVSWDQCQLFVAKLNQREKETGWVYRLPKMAEWEYACRGGPMSSKGDSGYDFYFYKPTNTLGWERANFAGGFNREVKVGSYEPNRLGLFDMFGNVAEWCDDVKKGEGPKRYLRGGCFLDESSKCRAQHFACGEASLKANILGLRLARVPSGAPSPDAKTPP